jgi:hypothetical protein
MIDWQRWSPKKTLFGCKKAVDSAHPERNGGMS